MDSERLQEIDARAAAAVAGPWKLAGAYTSEWDVGICTHPAAARDDRGYLADACDDAVAAFIAHARTDVPELVAEVRALQERLEACRVGALRARDAFEADRDEALDRATNAETAFMMQAERLAEVTAQAAVMREALWSLASYLGAAGQDAKHEWIAEHILPAKNPGTAGKALLARVALLEELAEGTAIYVREARWRLSELCPMVVALDKLDALRVPA
jgi:hypothetical protein